MFLTQHTYERNVVHALGDDFKTMCEKLAYSRHWSSWSVVEGKVKESVTCPQCQIKLGANP